MEKISSFVKNFKSVVIILCIGIGIFVLILSRVIPVAQHIIGVESDYKSAQSSLKDKKRTLENLKAKSVEEEDSKSSLSKNFYKPIEQGLDPETVISNAFAHVLEIMRNYSVKARTLQYDYNPQDDNFVKNTTDKYTVAKLDAEMISTYKNFESFLKELYKHEHFLDISSIEVVPYTKDRKILIIKCQLKLYAQK